MAVAGADSAAWCCTDVEIANVAAHSRASVTASAVTRSTVENPERREWLRTGARVGRLLGRALFAGKDFCPTQAE